MKNPDNETGSWVSDEDVIQSRLDIVRRHIELCLKAEPSAAALRSRTLVSNAMCVVEYNIALELRYPNYDFFADPNHVRSEWAIVQEALR